jgi:chromosome segregation ATPase
MAEAGATRAESSQLMDELRERLGQAESVAGDLRRHNESLQLRLDDASKEQAKQEEKMHEDDERIEELENAKRELLKQKRELETIFEAERAAVMKDKEATTAREEELQNVIQRLKDSLSQRDSLKPGSNDELGASRNCEFHYD